MTATAAAGCLSPEVERLLLDVLADGFTVYCCGPKAEPNALVAAYEWPHCIDLVTIRDFDRIIAARTPKHGDVNIFAPETVVWAYEGLPQWTLRALLHLVHPQHPDAPHDEYPAPISLRIRRAEQRPMTVRLPSPGHTEARARRLAPTSGRNTSPTPHPSGSPMLWHMNTVSPELPPTCEGAERRGQAREQEHR